MSQLGKRIFFVKATGMVVLDTGERSSTEPLIPSTIDGDFELYTELSKYNREALDYVELEYGDYKNEFVKGLNFTVNPESKELVFAAPEPKAITPIDERLVNIESSIIELAMIMAGGSEHV